MTEHEDMASGEVAAALREAAVSGGDELKRKTTRDAFATRLFLITVAVGLIVVLYFGYTTQKAVLATQHAAYDLQQQTRACVTPGTDCYKQRQKQTKDQITAIVAGVVGATNEVSIYSAWCANKPGFQTVAQIQKCVTNHVHPN